MRRLSLPGAAALLLALLALAAPLLRPSADAATILLRQPPGGSYPALTLSDSPAFSGGRFTHGTATSPTLALPATVRTYRFFWTPTASGSSSIVVGLHASGGQELFDFSGSTNQVVWHFASDNTSAHGLSTGAEHHIELAVDPGGEARFFLDGVLKQVIGYPGITTNPVLTIAVDGGTPVEAGGGYGGNGGLRDFAISSVKLHTTDFSPPTSHARDANTLYRWALATDGSGS